MALIAKSKSLSMQVSYLLSDSVQYNPCAFTKLNVHQYIEFTKLIVYYNNSLNSTWLGNSIPVCITACYYQLAGYII